MTTLTKGANAPVPAARVRVVLTWQPAAGGPDVDGSALLVGETGTVASDADFVFYNQPDHPSGSVRHTGKAAGTDTVEVDLDAVPGEVSRVVLAASADGGTFGQLSGLTLAVQDATTAGELVRFDFTATTETAIVSGELYRHAGGWKFRAVGQGYASGLAGLATDFGITVDDSPTPSAPTTPTPSGTAQTPPAPGPAPVPPAAPTPAPASTPPTSPPATENDDLLDLSTPLPASYGPPPSYTGGFPTVGGTP